jgi:hypothetical protein
MPACLAPRAAGHPPARSPAAAAPPRRRFGDQADQKKLPGADYRMQVQYLAYALVPLFAFVSVVALFKGMASLCGGGTKERGYERETV